MAALSALTDRFNAPNFVGELYEADRERTTFLSMIGGLNEGELVSSWQFPLRQAFSLDSGSQSTVTEAGSVTAPTAKTYARTQAHNVCEIIQSAVTVTYAKLSASGEFSGLNVDGMDPIENELTFQINAHLKQAAKNVEYSMLNGTYNLATANDEANQMRGIVNAISTNATNAAGAAISKTLIDNILTSMEENGAGFSNMVLFARGGLMPGLTDLYANVPESRNVGGAAIRQIETDFCLLGLQRCPQMPANTIMIADVAEINPIFLPVPGKGFLFYEALEKSGAAEKGQIYGQVGIDYGPEEYHGIITNLG